MSSEQGHTEDFAALAAALFAADAPGWVLYAGVDGTLTPVLAGSKELYPALGGYVPPDGTGLLALVYPGGPGDGRRVCVVGASGACGYFSEENPSMPRKTVAFADVVAGDLLRCAFGVPVDPPPFSRGQLLARMWLRSVSVAAANGLAVDDALIAGLDPLHTVLSATAAVEGWSEADVRALLDAPGPADGSDWASREVLDRVDTLSWDAVLALLDDKVPPVLAAWLGTYLRLKLAYLRLTPAPVAVGRLVERDKYRDVVDRLVAQLLTRGWWEGLVPTEGVPVPVSTTSR